jgi:hypothetical protein
MNKILNYFIRIILLIIAILIYNNYRNNQCIKNNNCRPIFITNLFSSVKNFKHPSLIKYKIYENLKYAEIIYDKKFNDEIIAKINNKNLAHINKDEQKKYVDLLTSSYNKNGDENIDIIYNSHLIIKKFIIKNTSSNVLKIKPKMILNFTNVNSIKIYNCFCENSIKLQPFEEKELFIYYKLIDENSGEMVLKFE